MTNETRNRIRAYMEELPLMKEKIFGALLMVVVAAVVAVSTSYAWVTLSRSPEVSEITTTLAANGALEIALSNPEGTEPQEFDIDESVTGDTNVTVSNLQWGNLVNLSDASYGIDDLALRPAQLNTTSLLNSPLWGAVYGMDGRITTLDSNYAYAKYNGSQFLTSDEYGVRAIATYKAEVSDATQLAYNERVQAVVAAHTAVNQAYEQVAPKFSALGTMISKYAADKLNEAYSDLAPYITNMIPIYKAVLETMEKQKVAYVELANLQSYLYANKLGQPYSPLTWENLYQNRAQYTTKNADTPSANKNISLVGLSQFITDYEKLQKDIFYLEQYHADYNDNGSSYYWGGYYAYKENQTQADGTTKEVTVKVPDNSVSGYALSNIVAHLIDYGTMTIDLDDNGQETAVVGLNSSHATKLAGANGKQRKVYIYNGILKNLEQTAVDESYRINGRAACTISIKYMGVTVTVYGKAYTKASGASDFMENYTTSLGEKLVANDAVAEDTYGLAIDLWVRTNAEEIGLTLEGATSTDQQGNIVSYDGVNRVWGTTGGAALTTDSTTQGGGSCYIYYADTPEDMARSLDLLNAMKVAFVDSAGNLLATAEMDTINYWAVNGRVTVPLVLDDQTSPTTYTYTDDQNMTQIGRAVTMLYADSPQRITAIVYLDGTILTNDHVLAAAEIQGSLNIQFGSSVALNTVGSSDLEDDKRSVTAEADKYLIDFANAATNAQKTSTVTLTVDGTQPEKITAFFVREINSTQGSRGVEKPFTKQADGTWTCAYQFDAPGVYWLRHVQLDGVDYALENPLKITVEGFALLNVEWDEATDSVTVRTSDNTYSVDVSATFASTNSGERPVSAQIRFVRGDGNVVNVPLTYDSGSSSGTSRWKGTATFTVSGSYTMEYIVYTLKGAAQSNYEDLEGFKKSLDLSLGMYVTVEDLSGGLMQDYDAAAAEQQVYYKDVAVRVYNNADAELQELTDLTLFYSNGGSASNTINAPLTYDEVNGGYTGTLPIAAAGRYQFIAVDLAGQLLTVARESPVYTVVPPDPPEYDTDSFNTANDTADGVQLVPLSNDAVIEGMTIDYSSAANLSVVVYSEEAQQYFELSTADGTVVNSGTDGSATTWTVKLPTYTLDLDEDGKPLENADYTQEGKWSVVAVKLSNCYDGNSVFHGSDDPILWAGQDAASQAYLSDNELSADATYDFSALSTDVSSSLKVRMFAGDTELGDKNTEFMTTFYTSQLDSYVKITDDAGNLIPEDKIGSVTLNISYTAPTTDKYGYAVKSGANRTYTLTMGEYDVETGYHIDSTEFWQYVGEYTVTNLNVTVRSVGGNVTQSYPGGDGTVDVPAMYTVTTAGPDAADITMTVTQDKAEFGKFGNNVDGTFLQTQTLGEYIYAKFALAGVTDTNNYVDVSDLVDKVELVLTYQDGKSAPNGGYSWTGTSQYEEITLEMVSDANGNYKAGSTPLLAGTYTAQVVATIKDDPNPITRTLTNLVAHSMLPDVTMALGEGTPTSVVASMTGLAYAVDSSLTFEGTNTVVDEGHSAIVYMKYETGVNAWHSDNCGSQDETPPKVSDYANYTKPTLAFTLSDPGTGVSNTMSIPKNQETVSWSSGSTATVGIGTVTTENKNDGNHGYDLFNARICNYMYETESVRVIGEQMVRTVTSTDDKGIAYERTLATPLSIVQNNTAVPSLTFLGVEEPFVTPADQYSDDGRSFTYTLPTVYTAGGAASVTTAVEKMTGQVIEGADVTGQLPAISTVVSDDSAWSADGAESPVGEYLVRKETPGTGEEHYYWRHGGWGFATYYYYTVTQTLYNRYAVNQKALQTITVENATISTVTSYDTYNAVRELDYWLIGDTRYEPGDTITVSGNLQARAVFKTTETKTGTRKLTESLTGTALFEYYITCSAEIVKQTKTETKTTTNYCAGSSCGTYTAKGSQTAATNAAAADAANIPDLSTTATKVSSVGTTRSNVSSEWQYNGVVVENGTSSTTDEYFDLAGNLIPNE